MIFEMFTTAVNMKQNGRLNGWTDLQQPAESQPHTQSLHTICMRRTLRFFACVIRMTTPMTTRTTTTNIVGDDDNDDGGDIIMLYVCCILLRCVGLCCCWYGFEMTCNILELWGEAALHALMLLASGYNAGVRVFKEKTKKEKSNASDL